MESDNDTSRNSVPLFTCKHHSPKQETAMQFCVYEKTIVVSNLLLSFVLIWQAYFVYMRIQKIQTSDLRIKILFLCFASSLYNFFHYGILYPDAKASQFFIIIMFRFSITFMVCFYYCDKATGILKSRKQLMKFLRFYGIFSLLAILTMAVLIIIDLMEDKYSRQDLCKDFKFQSFRFYSFFTGVLFYIVT